MIPPKLLADVKLSLMTNLTVMLAFDSVSVTFKSGPSETAASSLDFSFRSLTGSGSEIGISDGLIFQDCEHPFGFVTSLEILKLCPARVVQLLNSP